MPFMNPNSTFENESFGGPITVLTPLTGTTVVLKSEMEDVYINGTLAALNLNLPPVPAGQRREFYFAGVITTLSMRDRLGNVIATAPVASTAGMSCMMRYVNRTIGWVRWR